MDNGINEYDSLVFDIENIKAQIIDNKEIGIDDETWFLRARNALAYKRSLLIKLKNEKKNDEYINNKKNKLHEHYTNSLQQIKAKYERKLMNCQLSKSKDNVLLKLLRQYVGEEQFMVFCAIAEEESIKEKLKSLHEL